MLVFGFVSRLFPGIRIRKIQPNRTLEELIGPGLDGHSGQSIAEVVPERFEVSGRSRDLTRQFFDPGHFCFDHGDQGLGFLCHSIFPSLMKFPRQQFTPGSPLLLSLRDCLVHPAREAQD